MSVHITYTTADFGGRFWTTTDYRRRPEMAGMTTTTNLSQIARFIRAVAGDLPDPRSISIDNYQVSLIMETADDVRNWAAYFQGAPVTVKQGDPAIDQEHITYTSADCRWVEGATFRVVHLDYAVKPRDLPMDCEAV